MSSAVYAVLDVGGSSIKLGAVRGDEVVICEPVAARALDAADIVLAQLAIAVEEALTCARSLEPDPIAGLTIAFPGPFDLDGGRPLLHDQEKFDAIHGVDLRVALRERVDLGDLPIVFVRDSEAVGVGEAAFGAGRQERRVLTLALGTGLGACLTECGTVVDNVAGRDVETLYRWPTPHGCADDVLSARGLAELEGTGSPYGEFGRRLGSFIDDVSRTIAPDVVVIAGGIAAHFDAFAPGIAASTSVRCVPATLGMAGPVLGAARLGQQ